MSTLRPLMRTIARGLGAVLRAIEGSPVARYTPGALRADLLLARYSDEAALERLAARISWAAKERRSRRVA